MINNKYFSFVLLLLAEAIERFSYYFVSFILFFYFVVNPEHGGLGFSEETSIKINTYFSLGILFFPLLISPFIDRSIGYIKATLYGGCCLAIGYLFAFMAGYLFSWLLIFSLSFCIVGASLVKPTMSVLIGNLFRSSRILHNISYIIFVLVVSIASLGAAFISAKLSSPLESFKITFIISMILMICYLLIMFFIWKKNRNLFNTCNENNKQNLPTNIWLIILFICILIGLSTSISSKIFSFPFEITYWSLFLIGIVVLFYFWNKIIKHFKNKDYIYMMFIFFCFFLFINIFTKNIGTIASFWPSLYSSFDMLSNFFIFPLVLSFISLFAPQKVQVTFQSLAFFLFSLSSLIINNFLTTLALSSSQILFLLAGLILLTVSFSILFFIKLAKYSRYLPS